MSLTYRVRPAAGEPEGALVLLHGRGADEFDLEPLLDALDPDGRLTGILPRGPLSLPPGGAHWYVVPRVGYPDPPTFEASYRELADLLDGLPESLGVPYDRIALGGFSQGAVMSHALAEGPGRPRPAGVLALSGFVPTVEGWDVDPKGREGLPAFIAHGTQDPVIPVQFGQAARDRLTAAGLDVEYHESPIPHTIDPRLIPAMRDWLARVTSAATPS
jgi:phospholipase/carboxylesterase